MSRRFLFALSCIVLTSPVYAKYPSFVGDVVGRDLIGAGPVGHVGIASASYYKMRPTIVLEAMNTMPHIQQNTIEDFKSRSKYWGSKGGLLSPQSIESYTVANRVVRQYFACPEYTLTWRWKEGMIRDDTFPISCAIFRCDTLVNYAYAFEEGYSLPTYNTVWTTPLAVWNYLPVESDLFAPSKSNQQVSMGLISNKSGLDTLTAQTVLTLSGDEFYEILQQASPLSQQQIKNVWILITEHDVSDSLKNIFYDYMAFDAPDYLTHEIILQAKKERGELRHKLLVALQSIYQANSTLHSTNHLKVIGEFFYELKGQKMNKEDGGIVYRGLAALTSYKMDVEHADLINMDKIHVALMQMKKHRHQETQYVNTIISNLESPDDNLMLTASYQYLTQLLLTSDLKFFSEESKQLFLHHLAKKNLKDDSQSILYTPAYIEFKAALQASEKEEVPVLASQLLQSLTPDERASVPYGFSDFTRSNLIISSH